MTHSSGDFIVKNIRNHRLCTLRIGMIGLTVNLNALFSCYAVTLLFLWRHEDTSSFRLFSDDNSGQIIQIISNFSLRQRLHLLLALL